MLHFPNIERSAFRRGEYVGWDANGNRYRIVKNGPRASRGSWWVYPTSAKANTPPPLPIFYAGTLALVSLRLERLSAICAMPRLTHEITSGTHVSTDGRHWDYPRK